MLLRDNYMRLAELRVRQLQEKVLDQNLSNEEIAERDKLTKELSEMQKED